MKICVLTDFGSTFTKVVAVDVEACAIVAREQAPSTVNEDVMVGFHAALEKLRAKLPAGANVDRIVACSSAAGGLKVVAVGLVPELTVEAARRAALGAGAKVIAAFGYRLTRQDSERMVALAPDIVLLAGGTDGGDFASILHNADVLAKLPLDVPIIVAGNRMAADEAAAALSRAGRAVRVVDNVMPELGVLRVEPAREAIREIFIERIVHAKGLDRVREIADGVIMPTPLAVFRAAEVIAERMAGIDDGLVLVDVGGATTDVVSISEGNPTLPGVVRRTGLPEPRAMRTVEGDLGLRHNAQSILDHAGDKELAAATGEGVSDLRERVERYQREPARLPASGAEARTDVALAAAAAGAAMRRHAGRTERIFAPGGRSALVQTGKDLSAVSALIGTGGVLAFSGCARDILEASLAHDAYPEHLCPKNPRMFIDKEYVLFAVGLLADIAPDCAAVLAAKILQPL